MENQFTYIVEITPDGCKKGGMNTEKISINLSDPFEARADAIDHAITEINDPELLDEEEGDPTVEVFFQVNDKAHLIFSDDLENALVGLEEEAKQYLKSGLIQKDKLTPVYKNKKSASDDYSIPVFVLDPEELKRYPKMEYEIIHILDMNVEEILNHDY
jgi:hypothetical protein